MDKRPRTGRGPGPGAPQGPREGHCQGLHAKFCPRKEIGTSTLPARGEAVVGCAKAVSHSTRSVDISPPDPSRPRTGPSTHEPSTPQNPHPCLAGGLAGASGNDYAAAKLSRQMSLRCAALLASHPCHPSPPPEPFLSPEAGHSLAHGRHRGLKMAHAYPLQLMLDRGA